MENAAYLFPNEFVVLRTLMQLEGVVPDDVFITKLRLFFEPVFEYGRAKNIHPIGEPNHPGYKIVVIKSLSEIPTSPPSAE